eukprot:TRINITY_DN21485_c0_g1_i1.p1 TRINITY_DN21485_c0_g1~~TRINITY_DN21485_c0_g1_i1.p1  ORF type:complete len:326 (+),score=51.06 TRINITY_DN21485_c0_g1_i1:58-978(+)
MAAAAAAAALALLRLTASPAFVPGCSGFPSNSVLRAATGPATLQEGCLTAASRSEASSQSGVAVGIAAVALLAAAACRRSQYSTVSRGGAKSLAVKAVLHPEPLLAPSAAPAFAGGSLHKEGQARSKVALRGRGSLKCCDKLYFRHWWTYKKRVRTELRNRSFNMFWKNRYKKQMRKVIRYGAELEFGDSTPASLDEVMSNIKEQLDEACETIDFVSVQGCLHHNIAARRKDRMCRRILRGCIAKGIVEKPKDFSVAHKVLGYSMPKCYAVREPRPWQLPGWKTPWELRREFQKWEIATGRAFAKK